METYLDVPGDLWSNLEDSLGRLNYSMFLNPTVLDMWLDNFGAYDPDAQAADFFAIVETAIGPTFNIPRELNQRFKKWIKTLTVEWISRSFSVLHGNYKVWLLQGSIIRLTEHPFSFGTRAWSCGKMLRLIMIRV